MELPQKFRDDEILKIVEDAMLYMCACPGQVAAEIHRLRELFRYQRQCETEAGNHPQTHQTIAAATAQAHAALETCLEQVLAIEGWDRQTLTMPEGLRRQRDERLQPRP